MGSAAVVGSERISATTLSNEVANLTQAYQASKSKIQLQFPLSEAPQEVLSWLLRFRVRNEMAVRNHVAVSTGQSERALASIAASAGSTGIKNLAVANGLPPDLLPDLGRYEAIQNNLFARLNGGTLPRTQARIQALSPVFGERECVAAKSLNIQVNPQFGQMDYGTLSVIPATSPLSAPTAPAPAPSTKPRLTPPC
jgi:hypothetical protein